MDEALHVTASARTIWDGDQIGTALALAEREAARCAQARSLGWADREDLRQEILLAVVERARRFDAAIAPWAAFVTLLARHAAADWLRAEQQRRSVITASTEEMIDADATVDSFAVDDIDRGAARWRTPALLVLSRARRVALLAARRRAPHCVAVA